MKYFILIIGILLSSCSPIYKYNDKVKIRDGFYDQCPCGTIIEYYSRLYTNRYMIKFYCPSVEVEFFSEYQLERCEE